MIGRKGHPLARARSLRDLVDAEWATTTVTLKAEEELRDAFEEHGYRAAARAPDAIRGTMIVALANSDLLTMVPVQWTKFDAVSQSLGADPPEGNLPCALDRDRASRRFAADARRRVPAGSGSAAIVARKPASRSAK